MHYFVHKESKAEYRRPIFVGQFCRPTKSADENQSSVMRNRLIFVVRHNRPIKSAK